jgi:hypothetical protein
MENPDIFTMFLRAPKKNLSSTNLRVSRSAPSWKPTLPILLILPWKHHYFLRLRGDTGFLSVKASHSSTETETDLSSIESISFTNVSSVVAPVKRFEVEIFQVGDEVEVDVPRRGFVVAPVLHVPNIVVVEPPHAYTED